MRTSCYGQWLVSRVFSEIRLLSNEIQIYQTIHLLVNQLNSMEINYILIT